MENNVLNALDFLLKSDSKAEEAVDNGYDLARMYSDEEWLLKMVAYASQITPTKLEQRQATRTRIAEVLDREYETRPPIRIVVPSDEDIIKSCPDFNIITKGDFDHICIAMMEEAFISGGKHIKSEIKRLNSIESIRTLNPGAEVVEADSI